MIMYYQEPYGEYREFSDSDKFPTLPKGAIPIYILEDKELTFVWAFDDKREYLFEWDKISPMYNSYAWRDRS